MATHIRPLSPSMPFATNFEAVYSASREATAVTLTVSFHQVL